MNGQIVDLHEALNLAHISQVVQSTNKYSAVFKVIKHLEDGVFHETHVIKHSLISNFV